MVKKHVGAILKGKDEKGKKNYTLDKMKTTKIGNVNANKNNKCRKCGNYDVCGHTRLECTEPETKKRKH